MTEQHSVIGVDTTNATSASNHALGECAFGSDGTEWRYVQAASAQGITQYDAVSFTENFIASPLLAGALNSGEFVGFAQTAFTKNQFGWVACRGTNVRARVAASCNADVELYATGTAGVLDDAVTTATDKVVGVVAVTGSTTAIATDVEIRASWPRANTPGAGT